MSKVVIIINAEVSETGKLIPASQVTEKMVAALKKAVANDGLEMEIVAAGKIWSNSWQPKNSEEIIYCPLTIELPDLIQFPGKSVYKACQEIKETRLWVQENLGYKITTNKSSMGDLWLPVVLTTKGPIYGEVIAEGAIPNAYEQPVDITDEHRHYLYPLAYKLLEYFKALPSVYLLQFSWQRQIIFDRVWPFPAAPAIASIDVQRPDLFNCHWRCLTNQPLFELSISGMKE